MSDEKYSLPWFKAYLTKVRSYSKCSPKARNAADVCQQILLVVHKKNPDLEGKLQHAMCEMFKNHLFQADMFLSVWRPNEHVEGLPDVLHRYITGTQFEKEVIEIMSGRKTQREN